MTVENGKTELLQPNLKAILNDGQQLKILNYRKAFEERVLGRLIGREIDFQKIDTFLTPFDQWFVGHHFNIPSVDANNWKLTLEGSFKEPVSLSLNEIRKFKVVSQVVTFECCGNSAMSSPSEVIKNVSLFRLIIKGINFLNPLKWRELSDFFNRGARNGLISTAEFTGIRLWDLLERHPFKSETKELIFQGLDKGYDRISDFITLTKIHYERSFSVEELKTYDPIICFEMNGEPLPSLFGYPIRIIFPGLLGADNVKWLTGIRATQETFEGHFMINYHRNKEEIVEHGKKIITSYPARTQKVKSAIIRILNKEGLINVFGIAWCGKYPVKEVLVSKDSGENWVKASFIHEPGPYRWVFWKCIFDDCQSRTNITFIPKAIDTKGNQQPLTREKNIFFGNNVVIPAIVNIP